MLVSVAARIEPSILDVCMNQPDIRICCMFKFYIYMGQCFNSGFCESSELAKN